MDLQGRVAASQKSTRGDGKLLTIRTSPGNFKLLKQQTPDSSRLASVVLLPNPKQIDHWSLSPR